MCTADVVFSGPGQQKVTGDAVRSWLENFPIQTAMSWGFDRLEVSGDLAVGSGSGSMTFDIDREAVSSPFDFTDVFRKGDDSRWLYSWVTYNENEPAA